MVKSDIARDFLALGSWIFYALAIGRALIGPFRPFVDQLVITAFLIIVIGQVIKYEEYVARALILAVFTSLFYQDIIYTIFAFAAGLGVLMAAKYTGSNWKDILKGVLLGAIAILTGYYLPLVYL